MKPIRLFFIIVVLVLIAGTAFGANLQKLIPVDSPVYEKVKLLYLELGYAPAETSAPWTMAEFKYIVDRIPPNKLSANARKIYDEVLSALETPDTKTKTFHGSIGFEPTLEMYLHKNPTDYRLETDWSYDYVARKPLIKVPIEIFMTNYIYGITDFAIMRTRNSRDNETSETDSSEIFSPIFGFNNPFSESFVNHLDLNFPERAVASVGFDRINLTFGREDFRWSTGHTGSMTLDNHLDYYEAVRFTSFHDKFKYTYIVAGFDSPSWDSSNQNSTADITEGDLIKLYAAHRFEFRMFSNRVHFALTEGIIYQNSTIDFRHLNPSMFFHNLFIRGNANSTLALELNVNPYKHINIYANLLMDEMSYPGEDQTSSSSHPGAFGQQYGVEAMFPLSTGYIQGWLEFAMTDPYLYLRDEVDYIVNRRMFNMESGFSIKQNFLGYKFGNDAIVMAGGVGYRYSDYINVSLSSLFMIHGELNMHSEWGMGPVHVDRKTPSDDPGTPETVEKFLKITLAAESYPFTGTKSKHLKNLGVMTQLDYLHHWNKDNEAGRNTNDIQWVFGVNWKI